MVRGWGDPGVTLRIWCADRERAKHSEAQRSSVYGAERAQRAQPALLDPVLPEPGRRLLEKLSTKVNESTDLML